MYLGPNGVGALRIGGRLGLAVLCLAAGHTLLLVGSAFVARTELLERLVDGHVRGQDVAVDEQLDAWQGLLLWLLSAKSEQR